MFIYEISVFSNKKEFKQENMAGFFKRKKKRSRENSYFTKKKEKPII